MAYNGSIPIEGSPTSVVRFSMELKPDKTFKYIYSGLADSPEDYDWRAECYSLTGTYKADDADAKSLTFTVTGGKQQIQSSGLSYRVDNNYKPVESFKATLDGDKLQVFLFSSSGLNLSKGSSITMQEGLIFPDYIFASFLQLGQSRPQESGEVILLLPTIAKCNASDPSKIDIPVHGWVHQLRDHATIKKWVYKMVTSTSSAESSSSSSSPLPSSSSPSVLSASKSSGSSASPERSAEEMERYQRRIAPFFADNKENKSVAVQVVPPSAVKLPSEPEYYGDDSPEGEPIRLSGLSGDDGHFRDLVTLSKDAVNLVMREGSSSAWLTIKTVPEGAQTAEFTGRAVLLEDEGVSVISDIDDTVRLSMVAEKRLLVEYTFLKHFVPVPGMPEVFKSWEEELGASFHFVSGSPWQLYNPLSAFVDAHFPKSTVHLRTLRFADPTSISNFLSSPGEAKKEMIPAIVQRFPKRKFICVGDSGEQDPEVYAYIANRFPEQVIAIYIRRAAEKAVPVQPVDVERKRDKAKRRGKKMGSKMKGCVSWSTKEGEGKAKEATPVEVPEEDYAGCATDEVEAEEEREEEKFLLRRGIVPSESLTMERRAREEARFNALFGELVARGVICKVFSDAAELEVDLSELKSKLGDKGNDPLQDA